MLLSTLYNPGSRVPDAQHGNRAGKVLIKDSQPSLDFRPCCSLPDMVEPLGFGQDQRPHQAQIPCSAGACVPVWHYHKHRMLRECLPGASSVSRVNPGAM